MMRLPHGYEIHVHRPNGRLSVVMFLQAADDQEAGKLAFQMISGEMNSALVWRDDIFIGSLHRTGTTLRSQGLAMPPRQSAWQNTVRPNRQSQV